MKRRGFLTIGLLFIFSFPPIVLSGIFAANEMNDIATLVYTTGVMIGILIIAISLIDNDENRDTTKRS